MFSGYLGDLQRTLKKLPGIGEKTAQKLAVYLVDQGKDISLVLSDLIKKAVESYSNCSICNMLSDNNPCVFCSDTERKQDILCVVQHSQDVYLLEQTQQVKGRYFVLGNLLSPLDGIGPAEINFGQLKTIIENDGIQEVILALNPSAEGESTIDYIASKFKHLPVKITRLSTGIPFGGDIEYSTPVTLSNALVRRYTIE